MRKSEMREALVVSAVRTPVGRGHPEKGSLRSVAPSDLLGSCFVAAVDRAGLEPDVVDTAIAGCAYQIAQQSLGITRTAWLQKGLPERTGAMTIDVRCGSGQQAVNLGALRIAAGIDDVVVAGGVEHMGRVGFRVNEQAQAQWGHAFTDELKQRYELVSQGEGAERIADRYDVSRDEMDALALRSHQRAHEASVAGSFERELLAVETEDGTVTTDQGIRPDTSIEALGGLRAAFREDGRITAGNSSQVSDGAAALVLMSREAAERHGVRPRARVLDEVVVGVDPVTMLTGPIPATERILERNGLTIGDIDRFEVNEAFASVVLAWARVHEPDMDRVNTRGGAIAIGHPLGSTGARLMTTLLHELEDSDGELGLVTMCCGGGVGTATLIQRL